MTSFARHGALIALLGACTFAPTAQALTPTVDLLRCQKELTRIARSVTGLTAKSVHKCTEKALRCTLGAEIDAADPTDCLAGATTSCASVPTKLADKIAAIRAKALTKCGLIPTADVLAYIAGLGFANVATDCATLPSPLPPITVNAVPDLIDCVLAVSRCGAEREVFLRDPRAQDSLATIGLGAAFPCTSP